MADEYYNNKIVTTDGDVLMDLTQDTATPETVLEGETFHLRSGAPATGTYRPSDEIEARLRATVGHSAKNLLEITAATKIFNGVTFTVDKIAGTITASNTATSDSQFDFQGNAKSIADGIIKNGMIYSCEGTTSNLICALSYYDSSNAYISEQRATTSGTIISIPSNATGYKFWVRKRPAAGSDAFVFKPMLREASIADDTFEPYQIPTDELIARLDQRIYELERVNENPPDPDEGQYFITVFNNSGSDCDIWLTTPEIDGGKFYVKYERIWVSTYHKSLDYCGKHIMVLFEAGPSEIVMTLNSSQSGQGRFYEQFDVDRFLDMCDVKDGSSTNYISIHLCDDGGIRSQAEYEAYIGG